MVEIQGEPNSLHRTKLSPPQEILFCCIHPLPQKNTLLNQLGLRGPACSIYNILLKINLGPQNEVAMVPSFL